jgi:hypothetical protein
VNMKVTPPYNFCDPEQRKEWFDIVVALFQYLQSGESKVGFLNKKHPKNMLHKDIEAEVEEKENGTDESQSEEEVESEGDQEEPSTTAGPVQSSANKRASDKEAESGRKAKRRRREPPAA